MTVSDPPTEATTTKDISDLPSHTVPGIGLELDYENITGISISLCGLLFIIGFILPKTIGMAVLFVHIFLLVSSFYRMLVLENYHY